MSVYAELIAENAKLRAENAALRIAMDAIRTLTAMVEIPAVPALDEAAAAEPDEAPTPAPALDDEARGERLLERLRTAPLWPRAPKQRARGEYREPMWRPAPAAVADMVRYGSVAWSTGTDLPFTVLDKSGAHLAAVSSVEVAWDGLVHRGRIPWDGAAGYYYAPWFPWDEDSPHPLGAAADQARAQGGVWVPHTRVKLLADLVEQDRYPEIGNMDAWTSEHKARMNEWSTYVNGLRRRAIEEHGRDSEQYANVKAAFSSAITAMIGSRQPGQGRVWKTRQLRRIDWGQAIQDLAGCTMWRAFDAARQLAHQVGAPELGPVSVRNEDELWIPTAALELFTVQNRPGGTKPLFRLDETGINLGTWKVKA